jgi:hypothetical protein
LENLGVDVKNNIRVVLGVIGWEGVGWIYLAQNRDWWWALVKDSNEAFGFIKCWKFLD